MASQFFGDSIFWIDTDKIRPNPFQPRKEFDENALRDLAESIRMYGLLQPLVVTRSEIHKEDGGMTVEYELVSGERRLRASKLLGLAQVPALIRANTDDARVKLELAIIENLQREDLNPVERAKSFSQLSEEFGLKHVQIAQKIGKSREYVSNSIRLLMLPSEVLDALSQGKISEGHARPLMMLVDRPQEQMTLFKEIMFRRLTVRETESIARGIAVEKSRKAKAGANAELMEFEKKLSEVLHTRVQIEPRQKGGKITIDFFSPEDLKAIMDAMQSGGSASSVAGAGVASVAAAVAAVPAAPADSAIAESPVPLDDRSKEEKAQDDNTEDLYSMKNFSL